MNLNIKIIVTIITCMYSHAFSMELTVDNPNTTQDSVQKIREALIIPAEQCLAVDTFYKTVRNEYIKTNHAKSTSIILALDKKIEEVENLLPEIRSALVKVWDAQCKTMINIHLIKTSKNSEAVQKLANIPGIDAYIRDYFTEYKEFQERVAQESTNSVADSR